MDVKVYALTVVREDTSREMRPRNVCSFDTGEKVDLGSVASNHGAPSS